MLTSGSPAPAVELEDTAGQVWRLSDHLGTHSALMYFMRSTSCPICNSHVRDLVARRNEFAAEGIRVHIAVPEDRDRALAWKTKRGIPFSVLVGSDRTPHESIGLTRTVFGSMQQSGTILVDRDGIIRHAHGATLPTSSYDKKGILAAVDSMRSGTRS
ncbi:redoxin domain-containing protein [Nocardia cyriacigeorgica]|uniref:Redoxin domain-containing protein n=1 Tax=Nocardia cyriacigeorgica TaxID=135487 RepID=A0A6P1DAI6_9NOCA|nr:redoxin domain-containing protein [Nocardia cyriacigeorgica]NEW38591.1 redoxin domain-containing protein [Nocardia cyriacigeorgica]NEW45322.1 redoxin domain-containing protein [Nocardia cyriacigeorgica]NEW49616.1 redoxin domain-containing protein [Nocardia cyriacigeorgica]NEW57322.1 redoxin domain-containing protein [Nocardia cyriacigeorgica]